MHQNPAPGGRGFFSPMRVQNGLKTLGDPGKFTPRLPNPLLRAIGARVSFSDKKPWFRKKRIKNSTGNPLGVLEVCRPVCGVIPKIAGEKRVSPKP
ncbi:MAG: hypothetical protein CM15mP103_00860 [Gammaproteobacteria bacterium]|nr:MAG: hypothetical protein CM15mP103_00860 [Gammaproteobacteria bacterium]